MGQLVSDKNKVDTENLLDELPELERSIFEKYYIEGFPSREIAKQFNTKESWVHNKLSRGRKKLRSILMRNEVKKMTIYNKLNDVEINLDEFEEIELSKLEKKRILKRVKKDISLGGTRKNG